MDLVHQKWSKKIFQSQALFQNELDAFYSTSCRIFSLLVWYQILSSVSVCVTVEAVAAPITKRDRVAELYYITRGARNIKDATFEFSQMHAYYSLGFIIWSNVSTSPILKNRLVLRVKIPSGFESYHFVKFVILSPYFYPNNKDLRQTL